MSVERRAKDTTEDRREGDEGVGLTSSCLLSAWFILQNDTIEQSGTQERQDTHDFVSDERLARG